jgi:branched-chain amino acid transport system ATP-binding protein
MLTGIYAPTAGHIVYRGEPVTGLKPHRIAELGITRTFQNVRLFGSMTALENVMIGRSVRTTAGVAAATLRTKRHRSEEVSSARAAQEWLAFCGLAERTNNLAGALPYGEQRRLEIARALATDPTLICLDEPAAGMNPHESATLSDLVRAIRDRGITVLLIEHDMNVVMNTAERIYVLDFGRLIATGTPVEIQDNPAVIEAYLGRPRLEQGATGHTGEKPC